jgi:hypothetical protein
MRRVVWLMALVVAVVLAARLYPAFRSFLPGDYRVTVINRDRTELVDGELRVNEKIFAFHGLSPAEAVTFDVPVRHDGEYFVRASWDDGNTLSDSTGYVTSGISAGDTLEVRSSGLRLRNGSIESGH